MAIYTYKCPNCGKQLEKIVKSLNSIVFCDCLLVYSRIGGGNIELHPEMRLVPSVPSPMQWGCRKGF